MRIAVAGAGLAGLALAAGLARDGHDVVVLEADASMRSRPQGYRLHLDQRGLSALRAVLPPSSYDLVEHTCGEFAEPRELRILTARLRPVRTIATGPGAVSGRLVSTAADRGVLRQILAQAAIASGAQIRWGAVVSTYDEDARRVEVTITGGDRPDGPDRLEADLLVGCDGPRSRVAARRLPQLRVDDSGAGSIVGRAPTSALTPRLTELLSHGYVVVRGLRAGVGLGRLSFTTRPEEAGRSFGVSLDPVPDYVMWNIGLPAGHRGRWDVDQQELRRAALRRVRRWHPDIRDLVAAADPGSLFRANALLAARPEPWAPSRVSVIGDAAHVMPPDRGSGANLALADAAALVDALRPAATDRRAELLAAVGRVEREMLDRAFAVSEAGPTAQAPIGA